MTEKEQYEIDVSAILDIYVYLDAQNEAYNGLQLKNIVNKLESYKDNDEYYIKLIQILERRPEIGEFILISQSSCTKNTIDPEVKGREFSFDELVACVFKSPDGDTYFTYRGTGDGKWIDNGEAMADESSLMQRRAAEFFDSVIEKELLSENDRIIVTGHSKGGNSAQFVTLASKHFELVDVCYSFDGQGFSNKSIEMFENNLKNKLQTQIDKMYSINGENDYVHVIGNVIIPNIEGRTFYIKTPMASGFMEYHCLLYMIGEKDIIDLSELAQQGDIGIIAKQLSKETMLLDYEDLKHFSLSLMSILEFVTGGSIKGSGVTKFASAKDFLGFLKNLTPIICKTFVNILKIDKNIIINVMLSILALDNLSKFLIKSWNKIELLINSVSNLSNVISTTLNAWVEQLHSSMTNTIENVVEMISEKSDEEKQILAVVFNKLLSKATSFCKAIKHNVEEQFKNASKWINDLFGSGKGVLELAGEINVTISNIEEMQGRMGNLRNYYFDANEAIMNTYDIVNKVSSYYNESYIHNYCKDIELDISKSQRYFRNVVSEFDRKCRALKNAIESYQTTEQETVRYISGSVTSYGDLRSDGYINLESRISSKESSSSLVGFGYENDDDGHGVTAYLAKANANYSSEYIDAGANLYLGKAEAAWDSGISINNKERIYEYNKETGKYEDKDQLVFVHATVGFSTSITVAEIDAYANIGNEMLGVDLESEAAVGKTTVNLKGELSVTKDSINAYTGVEMKATGLEGSISGTLKIGPLVITGKVEGYVGSVGVEAEFGIKDNQFVIGGGIAAFLGVGAGIKIGINNESFKEISNTISNGFMI